MKPIQVISIILGTMLITIGLFGAGVYFDKKMDQICLSAETNNFADGIQETATKGK